MLQEAKPAQETEPAIIVEHISKFFPVSEIRNSQKEPDLQIRGGKFYALDDISFSIKKGECTLIAGANGSGKSLLMLIIAGLDGASSGTAQVSGRVGLVFQDADSQILGETPREDAAIGLKNLKNLKNQKNLKGANHKIDKKALQFNVEKVLDEVGLLEKAEFPSRFLSGGEKRRLSVAGILAMDCEIIIFDEPFANLDYHGVVQVNNLIKNLKEAGKTVLILTHEIEKCLALTERFIVLFCGKKVFDGTPREGLAGSGAGTGPELRQDAVWGLERFGIRNPLCSYSRLEDLVWDGGQGAQ